jgi:hypothetical protein
VDIPQLAVSGLEGPLLMGVKIPQSDVIDDHIFNQSIPRCIFWYRSMQICMLISGFYFCNSISIFSLGMKYFFIISRQWSFSIESKSFRYWNIQFYTLLSSFLRSKIDSSDLLVDPKNFLLGNSGRIMCNLSLVTNFSS